MNNLDRHVGIIAILLLQAFYPVSSQPPETGDWTVNGYEEYSNKTLNLTGNLIVKGTLKLENVTLNMNLSSVGQYGIIVESIGSFYVYNSTITSINKSNNYHFKVYGYLEMKYSNLSYCGYSSMDGSTFGLFIQSNSIIEKSNIRSNYFGLYIYLSNPEIIGNIIENNSGSGIYVHLCSPIIKKNTLRSNFWEGIDINGSAPIIEENEIAKNLEGIFTWGYSSAKIIKNHIYDCVVGIDSQWSSLTIENNTIENNDGIGLYLNNSTDFITNNRITGTKSAIYGVGIACLGKSRPTISNNTINNNACGGIGVYGNLPIILNNDISLNGFGIYVSGTSITFTNITVKNNGNDFYLGDKDFLGKYIGNAIAELINVTFSKAYVTTSCVLNVNWFLDLEVFWESNNMPIKDASVELYELNNPVKVYVGNTDENGAIRNIVAREYSLEGSTKKQTTPHKITTSFGDKVNTIALDINKNTYRKIFLDDVPPTLMIISPSNNTITNQTTINIEGKTEPDIIVIANYKSTKADNFGHFFVNVPLKYEGKNEINVEAIDSAGNVASAMLNVLKDTIPPIIKVDEPIDGSYTNKTYIVVKGETEKGANVSINDRTIENINGKFNTTLFIQEGENEIFVKVVDSAGNLAETRIKVFKDSKAPDILVAFPKDNFITNEMKEIAVTGMVYEEVELIINGILVSFVDGKFSFPITLTEGKNIITVEAKDKAGNLNKILLNVIYDTTLPTIELFDLPSITKKTKIFVNGTTEANSNVLINGKKAKVEDSNFSLLIELKEGENIIVIEAIDRAGNRAEVELKVFLDTKPPALTLNIPYEYTNKPDVIISGNCEKDCEVFLDGKKVATGFEFSIKVSLNEGENIIIIEAKDRAGNSNISKNKIYLDTEKPFLEIFLPKSHTKTKKGKIEVSGKTEPKTRVYINKIEFYSDDDGLFNGYVYLATGKNIINITAKDKAGNENSSTISIIREEAKEIDYIGIIAIIVIIMVFVCAIYFFKRKRKKEEETPYLFLKYR